MSDSQAVNKTKLTRLQSYGRTEGGCLLAKMGLRELGEERQNSRSVRAPNPSLPRDPASLCERYSGYLGQMRADKISSRDMI